MWQIVILLFASTVLAVRDKYFINFGDFVCPREERALGRCLRDALNRYIPQLATGVPGYDVPACEPLLVPALRLAQASGPVAISSTYTDVTIRGASTMRVKDIRVDSQNHEIIAKIFIPELRIKGKYRISGQLIILPISGEGLFTGKYDNIDTKVNITLGREPRTKGPDALACKDLQIEFKIGNATMYLDNLFGGDEGLGSTVNKFLNENWKKLSEELQVPLQSAMRDFLKPLADHAFKTLNADDILD